MKCNWEWLSAYLDGLLSDDKQALLEEHLKTCEACTAKLEEFARVETTAKKIPAPQLSEAYWENFVSRVQNKLTIREKRKTSPAWLEALKSFFQPTTGKLAIAGSLATILLVAIIGQDYWKKEAYQPPKFEAVAPPVNHKIDSVPEPAKDESAFRTAEKDNKAGLVEDKRLDQPARERATVTLSKKPVENAPAASAPLGRALAVPEEQKSKEEPSLAAFAERDKAVEGDTVLVIAGKKAKIRKETDSSQTKVTTKEVEKRPIRNITDLLKIQVGAIEPQVGIRARVPRDTLKIKEGSARKPGLPDSDIREYPLIKGGFDAQYGGKAMPSIDTAQLVTDIKKIISEKEKELRGKLSKAEVESLYIYLVQYYVQLYRFSLAQDDWKNADQRLTDFLKTELSDSARRWLVAIQAELKKLKK